MSKIIKRLHKWFNELMFTGVCVCGHSRFAHHGGVIMRRDIVSPRDVGGVIYLECEVGRINGEPTGETPCDCDWYIDKGWLFLRIKKWFERCK